MASRLTPYLNFHGEAREAMEFYQRVFGGTLDTMTFGQMGQGGDVNPEWLMHAQLETEAGYTLMGTDIPPGMEHERGNTVTVSLSGDDADQLRGYWEKLSDGGKVITALEKQVWGDEFGQCIDRYGIFWLVDIGEQQG